MTTKQEIKDEHRQSDGDPHMKGQIRARMRRMSRLRMIAEVASADAIVVNPTHVAVAIKYDPAKGAPRVVAKGADSLATKIREEAEKHRVPMVEDIPLARTLFRVCELADEIPHELYEAGPRRLTAAALHREHVRPAADRERHPPRPTAWFRGQGDRELRPLRGRRIARRRPGHLPDPLRDPVHRDHERRRPGGRGRRPLHP